MSQSQVVSPRPSGAGRTIDVFWPFPGGNLFNGSTAAITRGGVQSTIGSQGGGGGVGHTGTWDGETVQLNRCFIASDLSARTFSNQYAFDWRPLKGNGKDRPFGCYRIVGAMSASAFPTDNTTREMGFAVLRQGGGYLLKDSNDGFGIRVVDANNAELVVRGPNGVQRVAIPVDYTKLHTYDLRLIGATASLDAQLKLYVDGAGVALPAAFSSWAAGTNLPSPSWISSNINFYLGLVNYSGNAFDNSLCTKYLHMQAAPTEADLL